MRTALYRCYQGGRLLYAGVSIGVMTRLSEHSRAAQWWGEVDRITIETLPNRVAALEAERRAIMREHPAHNVVHGFHGWIRRQCHRDDAIGDLARDLAADPDAPPTNDVRAIAQYLRSAGACDGALQALESAVLEHAHGGRDGN